MTTIQRARPRLSLRTLAAAAGALSLLAVGGAWQWGRPHSAPPRPASTAEAIAGDASVLRRTEVAFADAQAVWHRLYGRYRMASVSFFTGATPTACAGGTAI